MKRFKVLAQSYVSNQRIAKIVTADCAANALGMVYAELDDCGFYVIQITEEV